MEVNFNYNKHGIYRVIPEKNRIISDGTVKRIEARVSNVSVNEKFTSTSQDGYKILKIGDKDKTIVGDRKYVIKYTYSIEKYDTKDGLDEFYFNILGDKINTDVNSVEYKIEFPKKYAKEDIYMYTGKMEYKIDGENVVDEKRGVTTDVMSDTVLAGKIDKPILPFRAVTLRIKLGKDYFILRNKYTDIFAKVGAIAACITFIYALIILYKYGRDKKLSDIITFKIPKELDVSKVYYLKYKGASDYRKIVQDYTGDSYKKCIFDALFSKGDIVTEKTIKKVGEKIVAAVTQSTEIMQDSEFDKEVYDQSGLNYVWKIIGSTIIPLIILILGGITFVGANGGLFKLFAIISVIISMAMSILCLMKATRTTTMVAVIIQLIVIIFMSVYAGLEAKFISGTGSSIYYIVSVVLLSLQVLISFWMEKKTKKGMMYEAQVNGFKRYVKAAREEELKEMVMEKPTVFFDILPYTYILRNI